MIAFLLWQAFVVIGLLGWGLLLRRLVRWKGVPAGRAIDLVVGIAVFGWVAAVLMLFVDLGPWTWVSLLAVGVMGWILELVPVIRTSAHEGAASWLRSGLVPAVVLLVTVVIATSNVFRRAWNACDDDPAYLYLARRAWLLGNLSDGFNNRRLTSPGLFPVLQGLGIGPLTENALHASDEFLGAILLLLVLWKRRDGSFNYLGAAVAIVIVAAHDVLGAGNSSPVLLPFAIVLCCLDMRLWIVDDHRTGIETATALGLGVSALTMIRPNFGLVLMAGFGAYQLVRLVVRRRTDAFGRLACFLGAAAVSAAPWLVLQHRDTGTWFFPFGTGNLDPAFPFRGAIDRVDPMRYLGDATRSLVSTGWLLPVLAALVVVLLSGIVLARHAPGDDVESSREAGVIRATAVVVGVAYTIAFSVTVRRSGLPADWPRFWAPLLAATVLAAGWPLLIRPFSELRASRPALAVTAGYLLAVGLFVFPVLGLGAAVVHVGQRFTPSGLDVAGTARFGSEERSYRAVARKIPPGSVVLVAADHPHLLLARDRRVLTVDLAAATGPAPHFPYRGTGSDKVAWLQSHGIDYVVTQRSGGLCLFNGTAWRKNIRRDDVYGDWTPFVLNWVDFADSLVPDAFYRSGDLVLIDVHELARARDGRPGSTGSSGGATVTLPPGTSIHPPTTRGKAT